MQSLHGDNTFWEILIATVLVKAYALWLLLIIYKRLRGNDVISNTRGKCFGLLSSLRGLLVVQIW